MGIREIRAQFGRDDFVGAPAAFDRALDDPLHAQARAHDAPGLVRADAKHRRLRAVARDAFARARRGVKRIAREVAILVHHLDELVAVVADELVAPIVEGEPVLRAAGRHLGVAQPVLTPGNPVKLSGPAVVDQAVFSRNESLKKPEEGLDETTLWALAVAASNVAERDGVA